MFCILFYREHFPLGYIIICQVVYSLKLEYFEDLEQLVSSVHLHQNQKIKLQFPTITVCENFGLSYIFPACGTRVMYVHMLIVQISAAVNPRRLAVMLIKTYFLCNVFVSHILFIVLMLDFNEDKHNGAESTYGIVHIILCYSIGQLSLNVFLTHKSLSTNLAS